MKRALILTTIALLCLICGGRESIGRLALMSHLPGLASTLLTDAASRGVALYDRGNFDAADDAFATAGRTQTFNRGLSLAATGKYELSVAYFDAVLFANPADNAARDMRDLVSKMVVPVVGDSNVPGRLAAVGGRPTKDVPQDTLPIIVDPEWQKKIEARGIAASDDWLFTINDDPGTYLKLRLEAEHNRRQGLGLIRPQQGDPW